MVTSDPTDGASFELMLMTVCICITALSFPENSADSMIIFACVCHFPTPGTREPKRDANSLKEIVGSNLNGGDDSIGYDRCVAGTRNPQRKLA
jgi:hypothetical protein